MNERDKHIEQLLDRLAGSTRSPRGKYSAGPTFSLLEKRIVAWRRRRFLRIASSVAAVIVLCVVSWSVYLYLSPAGLLTISTLAETKQVQLPDGSQITLNRYSALTYPEKFKKKNREVSLQGEAYFVVSKDTAHPFIVQTGLVDVRVLGTEFNVEAYPRDELVTTTLFGGAVAMEAEDGKSVVLAPGESAVYQKAGKLLAKTTHPALSDVKAWRDGAFVFNDIALKEIVRQLANAFNVEIRLDDKQLAEYKMTGRFVRGETLNEILGLLGEVGRFHVEQENENENETIYILSKH